MDNYSCNNFYSNECTSVLHNEYVNDETSIYFEFLTNHLKDTTGFEHIDSYHKQIHSFTHTGNFEFSLNPQNLRDEDELYKNEIYDMDTKTININQTSNDLGSPLLPHRNNDSCLDAECLHINKEENINLDEELIKNFFTIKYDPNFENLKIAEFFNDDDDALQINNENLNLCRHTDCFQKSQNVSINCNIPYENEHFTIEMDLFHFNNSTYTRENLVFPIDQLASSSIENCEINYQNYKSYDNNSSLSLPHHTSTKEKTSRKISQNIRQTVKCDECHKIFTSKYYLLQHKKAIHRTNVIFSCKLCGKNFATKPKLNQHRKKHESTNRFKCDKCPKQFHHRIDLTRHSYFHTGLHPFICDVCSKGFSRKDHFFQHKNRKDHKTINKKTIMHRKTPRIGS